MKTIANLNMIKSSLQLELISLLPKNIKKKIRAKRI